MQKTTWTCDRCGAEERGVPPDQVPPDWTRLSRGCFDALDLCPACSGAFSRWCSPKGLKMDEELRLLRPKVGEIPLTLLHAGYAECPDCATLVQVVPRTGGFTLRHVLHRT